MVFGLKDKEQQVRTYSSGKLYELVVEYLKYRNIKMKVDYIDVFPNIGLILTNYGEVSILKIEILLFKYLIKPKIK